MEFSKEIIAVLDYLFKKFGVVIDWTNNTVIPYLEQLAEKYINFKVATSTFWIVIGIILILGGSIVSFISYKKYCESLPYIAGLIACVGIALCGYFIYQIITCQTFPEKVLYDYVQSLVDGDSWR